MEENIERRAADELPLFEEAQQKAASAEAASFPENGPAPAYVNMPVPASGDMLASAPAPETVPAPVDMPVPDPAPEAVPAPADMPVPDPAPEAVPAPVDMPVPDPVPEVVPASADAAAPKPGRPVRTPPFPGTPRRSLVPAGLQPTPEFGKFLKSVREANGISLDDLARQTRIKRSYLDAVERESYSELPAVVYAMAYIKVLADYYGVDAEGQEVLTSEVRTHLECEVPEVNKTVVGYEISDENRVLLRRIIYVGAAGIFALALAITLTVLLLTSGRGESAGPTVRGGAPTGPDEDRLVEMQPKPVLKSHILPVPKR